MTTTDPIGPRPPCWCGVFLVCESHRYDVITGECYGYSADEDVDADD